tara:strand:+ start:464 stop:589 length:126 start_codon:yes stop_codon:yes gene_type:complete
MSPSTKEFSDNFFEFYRQYQAKIPPHKITYIFKDNADRLER